MRTKPQSENTRSTQLYQIWQPVWFEAPADADLVQPLSVRLLNPVPDAHLLALASCSRPLVAVRCIVQAIYSAVWCFPVEPQDGQPIVSTCLAAYAVRSVHGNRFESTPRNTSLRSHHGQGRPVRMGGKRAGLSCQGSLLAWPSAIWSHSLQSRRHCSWHPVSLWGCTEIPAAPRIGSLSCTSIFNQLLLSLPCHICIPVMPTSYPSW